MLAFDLIARFKQINKMKLYVPGWGDDYSYPLLGPALTRPIRWGIIVDAVVVLHHVQPGIGLPLKILIAQPPGHLIGRSCTGLARRRTPRQSEDRRGVVALVHAGLTLPAEARGCDRFPPVEVANSLLTNELNLADRQLTRVRARP